jgi:hypothetical protein
LANYLGIISKKNPRAHIDCHNTESSRILGGEGGNSAVETLGPILDRSSYIITESRSIGRIFFELNQWAGKGFEEMDNFPGSALESS